MLGEVFLQISEAKIDLCLLELLDVVTDIQIFYVIFPRNSFSTNSSQEASDFKQ